MATNTMGMVWVACRAATNDGVELATRMSGLSRFSKRASRYCRYLRIFASSWRGIKGFGTSSSHPAAGAVCLSRFSASEVTAVIGITGPSSRRSMRAGQLIRVEFNLADPLLDAHGCGRAE